MIKIRIAFAPKGRKRYVEVSGMRVSKYLAVNQDVSSDGKQHPHCTRWNITHLPTGHSVFDACFCSKEAAVKTAKFLSKFWRGGLGFKTRRDKNGGYYFPADLRDKWFQYVKDHHLSKEMLTSGDWTPK